VTDSPETALPSPGDWILFCAPGWTVHAMVWLMFHPHPVCDIHESQTVRPGEMILAQVPDLSGPFPVYLDVEEPLPRRPTLRGLHWPDGEPVTPWADPWHDVIGDVRKFKPDAEEHRNDPYWPGTDPRRADDPPVNEGNDS
jgi:hypothetical protein